jgi:hypothetical protein
MKKITALSMIALTATAFVPTFSMSVHAQSANAATIDKDFLCAGFVPNPDGSPGTLLIGSDSHSVANNGNQTTLQCHFTIPAGSEPATATHSSGFLCGTFLGVTDDSRMTASPGGNAVLTCRINGNK